MDLKLNIYQDRLCRKLDREVVANEFYLSTSICTEVIKLVDPESMAGLSALSKEGQIEVAIEVIKNGYPFFMELIKEIFELTDDDMRYLKIEEVTGVIVQIFRYSMGQLGKAVGVINRKN